MTADPTPLAQRLVQQASIALVPHTPGDDVLLRAAPAAVVAVLRELDLEAMRRVLANSDPIDLSALADSIEKGETSGDNR
jgi:hypothetical protein